MKTQHYKIKGSAENFSRGKSGQFVFQSNQDSEIIGFVDFVSDCDVFIMLFEPMELQDFMTNIQSECEYLPRLTEIMKADSEIAQQWADVI